MAYYILGTLLFIISAFFLITGKHKGTYKGEPVYLGVTKKHYKGATFELKDEFKLVRKINEKGWDPGVKVAKRS